MRILFFILIIFCSNLSAHAHSIHCPTVAELRGEGFIFWLPLYKIGEELAGDEDVKNFRANVKEFVEARWDTTYLETAHCFYRGSHPILDKIIFAQDAFRPEGTDWMWIKPSHLAQCQKDELSCSFMT